MGLLLRRRPLLRAAAVGGGAYYLGQRYAESAYQDQAVAAAGQMPAAQPRGALSSDAVARLAELGQLRDQGVLTEDEFAAQKTKLLGM